MTDSTNLCDDYTRNKIRHKILPVLEEINSEAVSNFTYFSSNSREVTVYIQNEALSVIKYADNGDGTYDVNRLLEYNSVIVREALVILFSVYSDKTLERKKIDEICLLLKQTGRIQIYGNVFAEVLKNKFRFFINKERTFLEPVMISETPVDVVFGDYRVKIAQYEKSSEKINKRVLDNLIDCDKIVGNIFLRTRCEGDKISLKNRKVTKTLKKLFNEAEIPVEERDNLPVLCDDVGIVGVYSFGVDTRCSVDSDSSNIIFVRGENNDW